MFADGAVWEGYRTLRMWGLAEERLMSLGAGFEFHSLVPFLFSLCKQTKDTMCQVDSAPACHLLLPGWIISLWIYRPKSTLAFLVALSQAILSQ